MVLKRCWALHSLLHSLYRLHWLHLVKRFVTDLNNICCLGCMGLHGWLEIGIVPWHCACPCPWAVAILFWDLVFWFFFFFDGFEGDEEQTFISINNCYTRTLDLQLKSKDLHWAALQKKIHAHLHEGQGSKDVMVLIAYIYCYDLTPWGTHWPK